MRHQPTLFFLASLLLLCSCQREKEYSFHKYHVINASLGDSGTRTTFESQEGSYDLLTKWQGHEYIKVFLNVDDGYNDAVRTVQVSKITADGTGATFRYKVPDEWGENDSYKVKMFTSTCLPGIMDGKIYYNASLIREPISSFQVPVFSEGEIVGEGELNASFHHYYTYELLHIKNTSNEDISFTLLGFEEGGWFKQKGSLCIDDGSFVVNAPSTKEPVTSTTVTVKAQESETIVSAYIPTGQPIQMARMVAQVNGQDVKSVNTKSSGVELKQGHAYHMYAGWNGKELRFWSNEEAPLDVETRSATFDPATFTGLFTGAVTNLADGGVKSVGFRFWREDDPEGYVEFDATLADDNTFSLALRYKEFLEIAGDASLKGSYKVSAFALKPDGSRFHGDILEFTIDKDQPELPTEPTAGNLIDLGLSVAWASHNVGATKPQEVGGFYAWGETSTKSSYDWSNYALADGSGNSLKKYCTQSSYGTVDNKTTLESSDDAAYAASQGRMRMPTAAEWQELKDYCVWTAMKYEGRDGYLVASPITRNAIFIPANGFKTGTSYYNFYAPYYWTADLDTESPSNALMVDYINQWSLGRQSRNEGLGIRPVSDGLDESTIEVEPTVLDFGKVAIGTSTSKTVTVTNTGTGSLTFYLVGGNEWFTFTPEDETTLAPGESCEVTITFRPQSASQMGVVLRVFSNATNGTKYVECTGEGVESLVPMPEMVDMGLSVLWASFNLGADSPTGKGKYYAWGETKAYGEDYPENENNFNYTGKTVKEKYYAETYIFGGQGRLHYVYGGRFSKYNGDDLNTLENQDDAAYLLLGEGWHIPTKEQWEELNNNTTWEQVDGGYRATSTVPGYTNVSIFLPYTGNRYEGSHLNGGYGVYWSSTLNQGEMVHGFNTSKEYGYHGITNEYRWDGLAIRPVHDKVASTTWEMVDLGLSVKWATCNLGASSSTELGQYYAWGETIPDKQDFSWETYKFGHTTMEMDKYNATDGVTVLSPEDDVVHMTYQGHWRMPTFEEWKELKDNCTWTEDLVNGVLKGYTITSSINGKSIYIPAGGYREGTELRNENTARYWASSLTNASPYYDGYNPGKARNLNENCYYWRLDWMGNDRCWGMQVRGVYDDSSALLSAGELIDMGLSVKWASCNLDASVPEDAGKYYAWGETNPDKTDFSWETYQFGNNAGSMTKYFDVDELHYLDWTDDVVHARLGGHWRMPTIEEWQELKDNCTWINSTRNGVRGYRIVSNINGNCIFLPISGFIDGTQLKDGMRPRYWASSFTNALKGYDGYDAGKARCLNESCYYWRLDLMGSDRYLGMTIRGIYDDSADILTEGETVDLGLSVEWASCNIGADAPEDFGTYYGWGETAPHESYSWENYAFSLGGTKTMTKYNDTDRKVVLDAEDDVVIQKTGGKLRMPTIDEIHELMDNTTQTL